MFPLPVSSEANAESKKKGGEKRERETENPSSHFPLDRAKHGNEGRWRPPSSPSPVGSYISSSSWLLKFMSTVVTRFIRDEKNRTDILYAFCEDACTPGLASLTHRGVSCSRTRGVNKIALIFFFFFFFLFFKWNRRRGCAFAMRWWWFVTEIDWILSSSRGIFIRAEIREIWG